MLTGCGDAGKQGEQNEPIRQFTDSIGRTVAVPAEISKIAISGPLSQVYILPLELFVALPYRPFVLACGVPGLGTEETAAIFADEPCSEYAVSAVPSTEGFCVFRAFIR